MSAPALQLRPPRHQVSRRAITWWTITTGTTALVVLAAAGVARYFTGPPPWVDVLGGLAALLVLAVPVVVPRWRFRIHRWETTELAVYTASGWLTQEWRVAPLSRIQTVDTERGPLQRALGLSTVTITTASAAGALTIVGLEEAVARDVVDQLTAVTEATPGDAT